MDSSLMRDRLQQRNIKHLMHFTKYSNFESIMAHGLVRRSELDRRMIHYAFNDDVRLDGHPNSVSVSISFPNYRMFYKARHDFPDADWVVLVLGTDVLLEKPCWFCKTNAASAYVQQEMLTDLSTKEAFDAMFGDVNGVKRDVLGIPDSFSTDPQAEILVFGNYSPLLITFGFSLLTT